MDANDPAYLQRFVRTFDLAPLTQNRVKVDLDWAAADSLGVGFEYLYKDNNYHTTMLGRTGDTRNEVYPERHLWNAVVVARDAVRRL